MKSLTSLEALAHPEHPLREQGADGITFYIGERESWRSVRSRIDPWGRIRCPTWQKGSTSAIQSAADRVFELLDFSDWVSQ